MNVISMISFKDEIEKLAVRVGMVTGAARGVIGRRAAQAARTLATEEGGVYAGVIRRRAARQNIKEGVIPRGAPSRRAAEQANTQSLATSNTKLQAGAQKARESRKATVIHPSDIKQQSNYGATPQVVNPTNITQAPGQATVNARLFDPASHPVAMPLSQMHQDPTKLHHQIASGRDVVNKAKDKKPGFWKNLGTAGKIGVGGIASAGLIGAGGIAYGAMKTPADTLDPYQRY